MSTRRRTDALTSAETHAVRSAAELWFDVCAMDVLGIKLLGRLKARTRALAEQEAARLYPGVRRLVSLSTRRGVRPRHEQPNSRRSR